MKPKIKNILKNKTFSFLEGSTTFAVIKIFMLIPYLFFWERKKFIKVSAFYFLHFLNGEIPNLLQILGSMALFTILPNWKEIGHSIIVLVTSGMIGIYILQKSLVFCYEQSFDSKSYLRTMLDDIDFTVFSSIFIFWTFLTVILIIYLTLLLGRFIVEYTN